MPNKTTKALREIIAPIPIITISEYWDCECEEDYIHHKLIKICLNCSTTQNDQPNSRLDEVIAFLFSTITS